MLQRVNFFNFEGKIKFIFRSHIIILYFNREFHKDKTKYILVVETIEEKKILFQPSLEWENHL